MITDMGSIISQMMVLVTIMVLGYILGKLKCIDHEGNTLLSKIAINVAASANVFASLLADDLPLNGEEALFFLFVTLGCYALAFVISLFVPILIRAPKEDYGVYRYITMFANCGFMGYPVAKAIYGEESVIYVTFFVISFNVIAYSLGVAMINHGREKLNFKKIFVTPIMITTAVSFILLALGVKPPKFLMGTAQTLSDMMTALAMLVIGVSLASMPIKEVFGEWRVIPVVLVRIVIAPIITWFVFKHFISDPMMLGIVTVLSGMPVASSATMLCIEHGANEKLAAKATFITTVFTAVTIPLLAYFLLR